MNDKTDLTSPAVFTKDLRLSVPVDEWLRIRAESARLGIPMTEWGRRQLQPAIDALPAVDDTAEPQS